MEQVGQCRVYNQDTLKSLLEDDLNYNPLKDLGKPIDENSAKISSPTRKASRAQSEVSPRRQQGVKFSSEVKLEEMPVETVVLTETKKKSPTISRKEKTQMTLNKARLEKYEQQQREVDLLSKKRIETQKAKREKKFNYLYDTVFNGMIDPQGILNEMDQMLAVNERAENRKKEDLYKEWKENVYDRIHGSIQEQVEALSTDEIERRHRAHFEAYLKTITKKGNQHYRGGVFRDVIIESDYDPLVPRHNAIKISTAGMVDPLKRELYRADNEKASLGMEVVSHGACPGKKMFPVGMYHQAEATPAGHFSEPDGTLKEPLEQYKATSAKKNASNLHLNEYNIARGKAVMLAEQPKTKGDVPLLGHRRDRADFTQVLTHTHHMAPKHVHGDDEWLIAKGKLPLEIPQDPNRRDLYPVIANLADHRQTGGCGDMWMSAKGKATNNNPNPPPGARNNLFEVVHQSEGAIPPGCTSGDKWIEAKGRRVFPAQGNDSSYIGDCMRDQTS